MARKEVKVLALLSGGLDSTLAVKVMLDQGIDVEAVHFTTPFCLCDKCSVDDAGRRFGIRVHGVFLGQEYLDMVLNPPHGYGSQMNPCIDCRILMLRKAKEMAREMGMVCIVTGEVLDERPFSQRREAMNAIEKEAGLEWEVLRPLSAKLLPETEVEREGLIDRGRLFSIRGRRRLPQMRLAERLGIHDYPCPSGGCLLTDPQFARRLRNHLEHGGELTLKEAALLRLGRHFRVGGGRIIVGRNEGENKRLLSIARRDGMPYLEVVGYMGPITLLAGDVGEEIVKRAAQITVRYSDALKDIEVEVRHTEKMTKTLKAQAATDREINGWRI